MEWDQRSTNILSDTESLYQTKAPFYTASGRASPAPSFSASDVNRYLARGPQHGEIELSRLDVPASQPLLPGQSYAVQSTSTLPVYSYHAQYDSPTMQYPPGVARPLLGSPPQLSRGATPHPTYPPPPESNDTNMAGRGLYRG